jgi:hypothetical protein
MKYSIITTTILLLLVGCDQPTVTEKDNNKVHVVKQTYMPPPPKKQIKLKEIDDTNFNADYMYPEDKKKTLDTSLEKPAVVTDNTMDKEQCIAMITQEKFDKYAMMFGSEAASIKRCKMLKATR